LFPAVIALNCSALCEIDLIEFVRQPADETCSASSGIKDRISTKPLEDFGADWDEHRANDIGPDFETVLVPRADLTFPQGSER
jgi:hypothetical protein